MPAWNGAWSEAEATAYLEDATVPIRLACRTPDGGLWMLSLWFRYRDGAFHCATGADADVVEYLEADSGVAFEVSDNDPPYRGVRGAGTATVDPDEGKALLEDLLERYLGGTDNALADRLLVDEREEVHVRIDPTRLYTWDFGERMADAV
ncbi:pyridoxamine 5'-phosphate oxidase family protein [Natronomonas marina]|jgi:nitroimidazol reductase NimA-like FMN-containing flavoprotein (pyridoxamine 5'-phosphate oxidase superfamily)|uniref:pyridoxamine 5'-phosphate oxidase family protein n=1 Tax=Natronomonas marina TaxID=2961939 RepID=UPI0020C95AE9|nr:pyridoxamine 5'-phosphate oxidase family protein [Natronomonas marina]